MKLILEELLQLSSLEAARVDLRAGAGDLLDDADDLVGVAELVVVPDVDHEVLTGGDGGQAVDDAGVGGADELPLI